MIPHAGWAIPPYAAAIRIGGEGGREELPMGGKRAHSYEDGAPQGLKVHTVTRMEHPRGQK